MFCETLSARCQHAVVGAINCTLTSPSALCAAACTARGGEGSSTGFSEGRLWGRADPRRQEGPPGRELLGAPKSGYIIGTRAARRGDWSNKARRGGGERRGSKASGASTGACFRAHRPATASTTRLPSPPSAPAGSAARSPRPAGWPSASPRTRSRPLREEIQAGVQKQKTSGGRSVGGKHPRHLWHKARSKPRRACGDGSSIDGRFLDNAR